MAVRNLHKLIHEISPADSPQEHKAATECSLTHSHTLTELPLSTEGRFGVEQGGKRQIGIASPEHGAPKARIRQRNKKKLEASDLV